MPVRWREADVVFHTYRPTTVTQMRVLSHWAHFTVFMCLHFMFFSYCTCQIIVSMVGSTWWDWSLILGTVSSFSALTRLGHLTCKNPSPMWHIMCLVAH